MIYWLQEKTDPDDLGPTWGGTAYETEAEALEAAGELEDALRYDHAYRTALGVIVAEVPPLEILELVHAARFDFRPDAELIALIAARVKHATIRGNRTREARERLNAAEALEAFEENARLEAERQTQRGGGE